jgi:hypothetical protein
VVCDHVGGCIIISLIGEELNLVSQLAFRVKIRDQMLGNGRLPATYIGICHQGTAQEDEDESEPECQFVGDFQMSKRGKHIFLRESDRRCPLEGCSSLSRQPGTPVVFSVCS